MSEALQPFEHQTTIMDRMRDDQGSIRTGLGIAVGVAALATAGFFVVKDKLPDWNPFPEAIGTPDNSEIRAMQEILEARESHCMTNGVFNVATSQAQTQAPLENAEKYFGKGVLAETGKIIEKDCIQAEGITYVEKVVDGKPSLVVTVKESAIEREVKFSEPDTRIVVLPKPGTELVEGIMSGGKAALELVCTGVVDIFGKDSVTVAGKTLTCDDLNVITQTDSIEDAELVSAFRESLLEAVRVQGGQESWPNVEPIFLDTFKQQAIKEGYDPNLITMEVVDKDDNPIEGAPSFADKPEQDLIDRGFLSEELEGGPELVFDSVVVEALPSKTETIQ